MAKYFILSLFILSISCSKESSSGSTTDCTKLSTILSSGKEFRKSLRVFKENQIEVDRKYHYASDTDNFITFKYLGSNKASVHTRESLFQNGSNFWRTLDTTYVGNFTINDVENKVQLEYISDGFNFDYKVYTMTLTFDSINCVLLRNREITSTSPKVKETFTHFTAN